MEENKSVSPFKSIILTIISIFSLLLFFSVDFYKFWYEHRVSFYWDEFLTQKDELDVDVRMRNRFGGPYIIGEMVKEQAKKEGIKDPVVLFEPNTYYKQNNIPFSAPEPIAFYFLSGLRATWINSPDSQLRKVTHIIYVDGRNANIDHVDSFGEVKKFLSAYSKYEVSL